MDLQVLAYLAQDGLDIAVVRFYVGGIELARVLAQGEVDFRERSLLDPDRKAFIADELGREDLRFGGAGFQAVTAVEVSGNSNGRAVKIDAYEGQGFSGVRIFHNAADTCGPLGGG